MLPGLLSIVSLNNAADKLVEQLTSTAVRLKMLMNTAFFIDAVYLVQRVTTRVPCRFYANYDFQQGHICVRSLDDVGHRGPVKRDDQMFSADTLSVVTLNPVSLLVWVVYKVVRIDIRFVK